MSLIEVMIAFGLTGLVAVMVSRVVTVGLKGQSSVVLRGDREAVKKMVLSAVSCEGTLSSGTCTPNSIVPLKRRLPDGSEVVLGPRFDKWVVAGECNSTGDGLLVRAVMMKQGTVVGSTNANDYFPDPLTNKVTTWSQSSSLLFPSGVELCTGDSGGAGPPDDSGGSGTSDIVLRGTSTRNISSGKSDGCPFKNPFIELKANCEPDEEAIAGGVDCTEEGDSVRMMVNAPMTDQSGWRGACCVKSGDANKTQVYALCRKK